MWRMAQKHLSNQRLEYCTKFSKFHMALRNAIVPAWNKEAHSSEGVKDNLGHSHNRICKSQWTVGTRPWEFFALAMVRMHCLA